MIFIDHVSLPLQWVYAQGSFPLWYSSNALRVKITKFENTTMTIAKILSITKWAPFRFNCGFI